MSWRLALFYEDQMDMFFKILISSTLCFLLSSFSMAQKNNLGFHYLTTDGELPANNANSILRDRKDNVWIGTAYRLYGYEGFKLNINSSDSENLKLINENKIIDSEKKLQANKTESVAKEPIRYDSLEELLKTTTNDTVIARKCTELCWFHRYYSLSLSLNYGTKALEIYKKQNDLPNQCDVLNKIGVAKRCHGQFIDALEDYYTVLSIAQKPSCNIQIAYAYNNIGDIYFRLEKYDEAKSYVSKSLAINRESKYKKGEAYNLILEGNIYEGQKRWLQAIASYKQAIKVRLDLGQSNYGDIPEKLGDCFMELNMSDSAFTYYNNVKDFGGISLRGYYLGLGKYHTSKKQYEQAIFYLKRSIELCSLKDQQKKITAYSLLHKIYFKIHDYEAAYIMQSKAVELIDGLQSGDNVKKMTKMQVSYDFEQKMKQKEIEKKKEEQLYKSEIKRQRTILFGLIIVLLAIGTAVIFIVRKSRYVKKTNRLLKEKNNEINNQNTSIQKSYSLLNATLESTADGILVVDKNGRITNFNRKFVELWGIPEPIVSSHDDEQAIAFVLSQLTNPESFLAKVKELYSDDLAISFDVLEFKDGRTFERYSQPQLFEGKNVGRVWSFRDITVHRQAEESLMKSEAALKEHNAAKDKFFSIIAHDLRGPINTFVGLTQILSEDSDSFTVEEIQKYTGSLKNSSSNLAGLLDNLLQWSGMQRGAIAFDPQQLHLLPVVNEVLAGINAIAQKKGIEIRCNIPVDTAIFADNNMLQTILRNLISNALKFTPRDGMVSLFAEPTKDGVVMITVKDSGIGMPEEIVKNLFRIDVKNVRREGTDGEPSSGLGLSLCKEFIEKHGGKIWVDSDVGAGTSFYFSMPRQQTADTDIAGNTPKQLVAVNKEVK